MARKIDWVAIEGAFRSGHMSIRQIAEDHGVSDMAIRKRAKAGSWVRDPSGAKRAMVKAALAGFRQSEKHAREIMEREAARDTEDMNLGLDVARKALRRLAEMVEGIEAPREVKVVVEANKIAIETIRKIRGLDDAVEEAGSAAIAAAAAEIPAAAAYARMIGR